MLTETIPMALPRRDRSSIPLAWLGTAVCTLRCVSHAQEGSTSCAQKKKSFLTVGRTELETTTPREYKPTFEMRGVSKFRLPQLPARVLICHKRTPHPERYICEMCGGDNLLLFYNLLPLSSMLRSYKKPRTPFKPLRTLSPDQSKTHKRYGKIRCDRL